MSDANIHNANPSGSDFKRALDSIPARGCVIKTRHGTMDARRRTLLMGIINVTPDSFYDGGKRLDPDRAMADGINMVEAGADILDIGGESTRPGAGVVSMEEELQRVLPVIQGLHRYL
jgi:dihydropteroate synthase